MAEVKKSGRGGKRAGAGRKKKGHSSPTALSELDLRAALGDEVPDDIETAAQRKARDAIGNLVKILKHGTSDAARIQAACAILDRGYGKPSVAAGGDPMLPLFGSKPVRETAPDVRDEARRFANLAILVLGRIADFGASESVKVTANKALLDRGIGTAATAKVPDELAGLRQKGKKEQAASAAERAGTGRYAPPEPPRGRLN